MNGEEQEAVNLVISTGQQILAPAQRLALMALRMLAQLAKKGTSLGVTTAGKGIGNLAQGFLDIHDYKGHHGLVAYATLSKDTRQGEEIKWLKWPDDLKRADLEEFSEKFKAADPSAAFSIYADPETGTKAVCFRSSDASAMEYCLREYLAAAHVSYEQQDEAIADTLVIQDGQKPQTFESCGYVWVPTPEEGLKEGVSSFEAKVIDKEGNELSIRARSDGSAAVFRGGASVLDMPANESAGLDINGATAMLSVSVAALLDPKELEKAKAKVQTSTLGGSLTSAQKTAGKKVTTNPKYTRHRTPTRTVPDRTHTHK